jgi:hypothetical protein
MGLSFRDSLNNGLLVYFRRISTGDSPGNVRAGLNEGHPEIAPQAEFDIEDVTPMEKEIIGSWCQRQTVSHILQFKAWMLLTYSRNFVQNRKMEITYNKEKKQFCISPLTRDDYSGEKEMLFKKPVGQVPLQLVEPHSEGTASYYLVAAGGEWVHESVGIVFVIL